MNERHHDVHVNSTRERDSILGPVEQQKVRRREIALGSRKNSQIFGGCLSRGCNATVSFEI